MDRIDRYGPCPDLILDYKDKDSTVWYHAPHVYDGGRMVQGHFNEKDGYFYVHMGCDSFIGMIDEDVIRFKPQVNTTYKVYMDPKILSKIYVNTTYERVKYVRELQGYLVLETCQG
jgi:hypothetical protein